MSAISGCQLECQRFKAAAPALLRGDCTVTGAWCAVHVSEAASKP